MNTSVIYKGFAILHPYILFLTNNMTYRTPAHFLWTQNYPIYDQLCLEEAFLRTSSEYLVWINCGSIEAIILGISSKIDELVERSIASEKNLQLIRRYSGGGTVVVDHNTIFVTLISNTDLWSIEPFPAKIMEWSSRYYAPFLSHLGFKLQENDYVLNNRKFGGNAQYLSKKRFVHHTTLLWDFNPDFMQALKNPAKAPKYRDHRHHLDFLTTLNLHFHSQDQFVGIFVENLKKDFNLLSTTPEKLLSNLKQPFRQSTHKIE